MDGNNASLQDQIAHLIAELHDADGLKRQRARHALIHFGWDAIPALTEAIAEEKGHARWEAIEALSRMNAPSAVPALVETLKDEDVGVRWAASNALIAQDRASLEPLLEALLKDFGSVWFRQGAHHVLHVLKDRHRLLPKEIKVFEALESIAPEAEAPWAAEAALEDLRYSHKR